jgi:hypothetical protein
MSRVEVHKHRIALQRLSQNNLQITQANSQMLAVRLHLHPPSPNPYPTVPALISCLTMTALVLIFYSCDVAPQLMVKLDSALIVRDSVMPVRHNNT